MALQRGPAGLAALQQQQQQQGQQRAAAVSRGGSKGSYRQGTLDSSLVAWLLQYLASLCLSSLVQVRVFVAQSVEQGRVWHRVARRGEQGSMHSDVGVNGVAREQSG